MENTHINRAKYSNYESIGSVHWFNTLLSQVSRMGEYLAKNETPKKHLIQEYGDKIHNIALDLIEWREQIEVPERHLSSIILKIEEHAVLLKAYKECISIK